MSDRVEEVLRGAGLSDKPWDFDSNIHSWRCERPATYGECNCFQDLVNEITGEIRKAKEEAWREGADFQFVNSPFPSTMESGNNPYRKEENE